MKYVKTFERFALNEGMSLEPNIPIDDQLQELIDDGKLEGDKERLAGEFINLQRNCDTTKKVVGSESYNKRLEILKRLGFTDTSEFEEMWKEFDQYEGF